ncbi:TPA: hypothetical protein JD825_RS22720 [Citrobacter freundii]|uniref:hypothetical protein n=1 Tax=Citrobacter sp. Awk 2 TaxID=2963959 RepID=UPI001A27B63D|nr:hypothetical protein [Citrobacter sp. Awk 2]HAT2340076.1 hypothetical protein [Citrobacter freundii]MDA8502904.1 hypothetical protein [Citrobacter sp. Awk 2]HAT2362565.1 hypothetical protein [Citrobacter freundii]HCD1220524.1 hypothetical protein [Citrobacter freundii]HCD1225803.1 hypothetical protein [Citrobacter freundii]
MADNLFGTDRTYRDSGDFTQRYFYLLRGCVPPPAKRQAELRVQPVAKAEPKSQRQHAMDKARANANRRYKGK